jgi:lysophospholipase L1-like esterase
MNWRLVLRVIGWNAGILLAGLVCAEAIFGGWFRSGGMGAVHVPRSVTVHHDLRNSIQSAGKAVYSRDRWGFRGHLEDPSKVDVLAVGGSTTNEFYVDDNRTWTAVLQRSFAEAGRPVVVVNAGVDGHSTVGHIYSFDAWFSRVPNFRPRFVLFYVGINDVHVELHQRYDDIIADTFWERARRYVSNNSALGSAFRTLRGMVAARRVRLVYMDDPPKLKPATATVKVDRAPYAERLTAYAKRLHVLAAKTRDFGARPIFVTQRRGDAFVNNGNVMATGSAALIARKVQEYFNETTMRVCREEKAICIDLASEIDLAAEDFSDAIHTNPWGSAKIGRFLYRQLEKVI